MAPGFNPLVAPDSAMDSDPPLPGNRFVVGVCMIVVAEGMTRVTVVPAAILEELGLKLMVAVTSGLKLVEERGLKELGIFH